MYSLPASRGLHGLTATQLSQVRSISPRGQGVPCIVSTKLQCCSGKRGRDTPHTAITFLHNIIESSRARDPHAAQCAMARAPKTKRQRKALEKHSIRLTSDASHAKSVLTVVPYRTRHCGLSALRIWKMSKKSVCNLCVTVYGITEAYRMCSGSQLAASTRTFAFWPLRDRDPRGSGARCVSA